MLDKSSITELPLLALHLLSVFDSCFCSPFELLARIFLARFSPILLDEMSSFIVFFPNGCATFITNCRNELFYPNTV